MTDLPMGYDLALIDNSQSHGVSLNPAHYHGLSDAEIAEEIHTVIRERVEVDVTCSQSDMATFIAEVRASER